MYNVTEKQIKADNRIQGAALACVFLLFLGMMAGYMVMLVSSALNYEPNELTTPIAVKLVYASYAVGGLLMLLFCVFCVYVVVNGLYAGFSAWWVPYLYIWTVLWAVVMLIPRRLPKKLLAVIYAAVCCLHGLAFGILYAPVQALMYGFDLEQALAWIAAGFTFDILHGVGNLAAGLLIMPLSELLLKLVRKKA